MKRGSPRRFRAIGLVLAALLGTCAFQSTQAQADQTQTAQLLSKAHVLEAQNHIVLAKQIWRQVLLVDPNNAEALAGMARAARSEGKPDEAAAYLDRLRAVNPNDPNIARIEATTGVSGDRGDALHEAGMLAQSGQYARAMAVLHRAFGDNPPENAAMPFYLIEGGREEGRPHAIAGLRGLVARHPQDPRYQIALGKVMTYDPRTRVEGWHLLEKYPDDPDAMEALRTSMLWAPRNPAYAGAIREYLAQHHDEQLIAALGDHGRVNPGPVNPAPVNRGYVNPGPPVAGRPGRPSHRQSPAELAAQRLSGTQRADLRAAYRELSAKHFGAAEVKFQAILASNPSNAQALAGMGYVRMGQSNFAGAISFLEDAENAGNRNRAIEKALYDSRFYAKMQDATAALNQNQLADAQKDFSEAANMRPRDPQPLLGLGGTLLKAQQPEPAIGVFIQCIKLDPRDPAAWRGLLMAQAGATRYREALDTDHRVPAKVKAELVHDPDYLRTLAVAYAALGRDADAQRVFQAALDLPFPSNGSGLKTDVLLQYASLLSAAHHKEQAIGLYRQVLAADPNNAGAYEGLVANEHELGHEAEAYQTIQSMPPPIYEQAMQEPGFVVTVAAIEANQGHADVAQVILERLLDKQHAEGRAPFVPAELQLAGIYLDHDNSVKAYGLYSFIVHSNPERADAWTGLLSALHATHHDQEAILQLQQIPPAIRRNLELDPSFLETVGSIYAGVGDSEQAMFFFSRVQQRYAAEGRMPPADVDIQNAWLFYNGGNDAALYRQLMVIGSRADLSDAQRSTVQTIWTNWAVRRANQASSRGDYRRAIAILNATAMAFPGNPTVVKALASGYASAGMAKEAVQIFRAQDLNNASAADYKAAIGAALAANDLQDAEIWLRFGLDQYPRDPQMLVLAAKFEQTRGDPNRALDYYRASLELMPATDAGAILAGELSRPAPGGPPVLPERRQPQDLATLLSSPDAPNRNLQAPPAQSPYLPGSNPGFPPVQVAPGAGFSYPSDGAMGAPQNNSYPGASYPTPAPEQPATPNRPTGPRSSTLKDYAPQSRLSTPAVPQTSAITTQAELHLHPSPAMEAKYGPYVVYDPSSSVPHFASANFQLGDGDASGARPAVHMVTASFTGQQTAPDGTPIVSYVPNSGVQSQVAQSSTVHPVSSKHRLAARRAKAQAAQRAAAMRANQAAAPAMNGQSRPTQVLTLSAPATAPTASLTNANYVPQPYAAAPEPQQQQGQSTGLYSTSAPQQPPQTGNQQYPQPHTGDSTNTNPAPPTHRRKHPAAASNTAAAAQPQPTTPAQPPINYPSYAAPSGQYPQAAPSMGQPPSDYDLQQRNLPPLRGYYDPRPDPHTPLNERQQAELSVASIEGTYSGWLGGTVIGRYRSGNPGIDRLAALEVPFEASVVVGNGLRLSFIPKAVFLNNGQLNTANFSPSAPILGSLYGGTTVNPEEQFASGIGGEFQLATGTFAGAVGFTPYEFLVTNVIGRARWRPGNGHFTFYGGRDPVRETELSYAGLRDPGSATTTYGGNVWGGVVETGGGVRFDTGGERAGMYISGEGADLSGYHVLENRKYDGTAGAYFRVRTWPEYGSINVGGFFFGEHFDHNELGETYGLGGYFSPEAYFLAAVPVTFSGHHGSDINYFINGSIGVQTFQQDNQIYFPLDSTLQSGAVTACQATSGTTTGIINRTCGQTPVNSSTGLNYSIDSEVSYHATDHWYLGVFFSANNTNNYNTVSGGFFGRYTFRPEYPVQNYPTGLFPIEGLRPLRVP